MDEPCRCVLRTIFRMSLRKMRECTFRYESYSSSWSNDGEIKTGTGKRGVYVSRKNENFIADFCLIAKRTLTNATDYRIFKTHFLLGSEWRDCCRVLRIDRGTFFSRVYVIEAKLGRAFRETKPYSIFPHREYFHG